MKRIQNIKKKGNGNVKNLCMMHHRTRKIKLVDGWIQKRNTKMTIDDKVMIISTRYNFNEGNK